jgi:hypothetical protein
MPILCMPLVLLLLLEFEMKEHMNDIPTTFPTISQHLALTIEQSSKPIWDYNR